jgi:hypothetical protein
VPENLEPTIEPSTSAGRRGRSESVASRAVIFGLDALERKISFVAGAIALLAAGIFFPHLLKNTYITETAKHVKGKVCAKGYHLVSNSCNRQELTHPSYWLPQFLLILVMALAIFLFAWRRQRVGVIFAGLFLGLAAGTAGLIFIFFAAWLGVRAWRLHKYGDASFSGAGKMASQRARERKSNPGATRSKTKQGDVTIVPPKNAAPREASKRYTPKKQTRKR